jgi:hypothetical protein
LNRAASPRAISGDPATRQKHGGDQGDSGSVSRD